MDLKTEKPVSSGHRLTVILRNDGPLINSDDSPSFRRVTIDLSDEQIKALMLQPVAVSMGKVIHEGISNCFLEE